MFQQATVISAGGGNGRFQVKTASGEFLAAQLLISAGAWSKPLAEAFGYRVPLDTERGYHLTLPGLRPAFDLPIVSFDRKIIMTPMSMGLRMTGTVEFGGLQLPPDPHRFTLLKKHLAALLPDANAAGASTWMGFRPSLPDHLPMLGAAPRHPGLFFAFGHQHLGLTLAGVTARLITHIMSGRAADVPLAPFAADRFH